MPIATHESDAVNKPDVFVFSYDVLKHVGNEQQKLFQHTVGWKLPDTHEGMKDLERIVFKFNKAELDKILSDNPTVYERSDYIDPQTGEKNAAMIVREANGDLNRLDYYTDGEPSNTGPLETCNIMFKDNKAFHFERIVPNSVHNQKSTDYATCRALQRVIFGASADDLLTFVGISKVSSSAVPKNELV